MSLLGVFSNIYPDGEMTILRALLISAVGFSIVFLILGAIALFVKLMGKSFDAVRSNKTDSPSEELRRVSSENKGQALQPLPENESQGSLTLTDVSEEEAAVIMAIVSKQSGIPLNRLQFNSIKLLGDTKS